MNLEDLKKLTAGQLREIAHEQAGVQGAVGMKKEELIETLIPWYKEKGEWVEIEHHAHAAKGKKAKPVETKTQVKQRIRGLKGDWDKLVAAKDATGLARLRQKIKRSKRRLAALVD